MRLKDKVAVITGAASGFGKASAELFCKEGAKVVAVDINREGVEEVVSRIRDGGGEAIAVQADITKSNDVERIFKTTIEKYSTLNVLFNNAGIDHMKKILDTTEEEWDRVMAVNLKGTWLCSKYAIPHLIAAGGGSMIHTSSLSALKARPGNTCYSASKAGILMMSQVLAIELAPNKIRSNCICPVVADTPMGERFLKSAQAMYGVELQEWDFEAAKNIAKTTVPLGEICTPTDVAYAAVFLASDESRLISGIYILIDGASRAG
jgi:NAD(P)-dependent dehydrogenase (short-subunit alcohol dehydrogenase family)